MNDRASTRWLRCSITGLAALAGSFALTIATVFVYAFRRAFEVRGEPDQARIQAFGSAIGPTVTPWLAQALVFAGAAWVSRSSRAALQEAAIVGVSAAVAGLVVAWPTDTRSVAFLVATIGTALLGGLAERRRALTRETRP